DDGIDGMELRRPEVPALERSGPEVLDDDDAEADELQEHVAAARGADVERDAALVPVRHRKPDTATARAVDRCRTGGRQLDHDDLGTEGAEQPGRRRARGPTPQGEQHPAGPRS